MEPRMRIWRPNRVPGGAGEIEDLGSVGRGGGRRKGIRFGAGKGEKSKAWRGRRREP